MLAPLEGSFKGFKRTSKIGFSDASESSETDESPENPFDDEETDFLPEFENSSSSDSFEEYNAMNGLHFWCDLGEQDSLLEECTKLLSKISLDNSSKILTEEATTFQEFLVLENFFSSEYENTLPLLKGEIIFVLTSGGNEQWSFGFNQKGERGYFPKNFIEPVTLFEEKKKLIYSNEFMKKFENQCKEKPQFLSYRLPYFLQKDFKEKNEDKKSWR